MNMFIHHYGRSQDMNSCHTQTLRSSQTTFAGAGEGEKGFHRSPQIRPSLQMTSSQHGGFAEVVAPANVLGEAGDN